jgi:hypothetical protein
MNYALKEALKQTPFVDIGDFNAVVFNVITLANGNFSLITELFYLGDENGEENEYGIVIRTGIEDDNLVGIAANIKVLLDIGLYNHLVFIQEAVCMNIDGEEKYRFDWDDYMSTSRLLVN